MGYPSEREGYERGLASGKGEALPGAASFFWSRSTMDSIRVSEALDPGSIPGGTTLFDVFSYKLLILWVLLSIALFNA